MSKVVKQVEGFTYTTAIKKLRKLKKRIRVIPGGTSAGKTYGILPILIDLATRTELLEISVVSESVPHLRKGALKDFLKIMKATGRYIDSNYNRTLLTYTFSNGSYIEFFSADQEDKVRGPRRNILYINECNNITFETYHQLAIRTSDTIWLDFNPSESFWAYDELENDKDADWLILTYKDNEALHPNIVSEIEKGLEKGFINPNGNLDDEKNIKSKFWANWWKVYGLGLKGAIEGVLVPISELNFIDTSKVELKDTLFRFAVGDPANTGGDNYSMMFCWVIQENNQFQVVVKDVIYSNIGIEALTEQIIQKLHDNLIEECFLEANGVGLASYLLLKKAIENHAKITPFTTTENKEVKILSHFESIIRYLSFDNSYKEKEQYNSFIKHLTSYQKENENNVNKHKIDAIDNASMVAKAFKIKYAKQLFGK